MGSSVSVVVTTKTRCSDYCDQLVGHEHSREEMLAAALEATLEDGLSRLTFGRLATRLGTSDRTAVYYVPTKDDLVTSVLVVMGERLQDVLADSFAAPAVAHVALVAAAWPALARPGVDRLLGLYFEAIGLAAAGLQPCRALAWQLVEGRIGWLGDNVVGDPDVQRGRPRRRPAAPLTSYGATCSTGRSWISWTSTFGGWAKA